MDKTVGVLGGGQLGRMLTEAANRLNVRVVTLDSDTSPAVQINAHKDHVNGSFADPKAIHKLATRCDVLTAETEHVDTAALKNICSATVNRVDVQPSWETLRVIQDKYDQKLHLALRNFPISQAFPIQSSTVKDMRQAGKVLGYPMMLKSRTEGHDGRGNCPIRNASEISYALEKLKDRPLYAEKWVDFVAELAVMAVKVKEEVSESGKEWEEVAIMAYPVVETIQENSVCKLVYAPARNVSEHTMQQAQALARRAVAGFGGRGVFGVEMFLCKDDDLLVNEIAPRPHNSGHYTIEACPISQYEAHLRAILNLPIAQGSTQMRNSSTFVVMINILGGEQSQSYLRVVQEALSIEGASLHLYGKGDDRPGRKMGHVTILAGSMEEVEDRARPLLKIVENIRAGRQTNFTLSPTNTNSANNTTPVAIVTGSKSDQPILERGTKLLDELRISYVTSVISAHRMPREMYEFAEGAASRGFKVIIAAAGGAAHLPGMIVSLTHIPVIGIPVNATSLNGYDSLLCTVQMPAGCPVATVGIDNSANAAQLAVRILALDDADLRERLNQYLRDQTATAKGSD